MIESTDPFFTKRAPLANSVPKDIEYFVQHTLRGLRDRFGQKLNINDAAMYIYNLYNISPEQVKEWVARYWNQ